MSPETIEIAYDSDEGRRELHFGEVILATLRRELVRRRNLEPHDQLGVAPHANSAALDQAFRTLSSSYDPSRFAAYGHEVHALAAQLHGLVGDAHARLSAGLAPQKPLGPAPPREEVTRARVRLRELIAGRLDEARQLEQAGRLREAAGVLEAVVLADRGNAEARARLAELRQRLDEESRGGLHRALRKLLIRRSAGE